MIVPRNRLLVWVALIVLPFALLAGVEPFIRAAQMSAAAQGGRGQGSPSLSIPGLDGFDSP